MTADAGYLHPFEQDRRLLRVAPFVGALVVAFALLHLQSEGDPRQILAAAITAAMIVAAAGIAPWQRLPTWTQVAPPLAFLAVVGLLRDSDGGALSSFAPLALLPALWLALYGRRRELVIGITGIAAMFLLPIVLIGAPDYPASEWRDAITWILVAALAGITVHGLVSELRGRAARLEESASLDSLTALPNRRAWDSRLPRELTRARRSGQPLCVAMLDLDEFKAFNDAYGHQAGDQLLRVIGATWSTQLRDTDLLARFGGDEFVALFPGCPLEAAPGLLARLAEVLPEGQTVSIGFAAWDQQEAPELLVLRADRALYEAKKRGTGQLAAAE